MLILTRRVGEKIRVGDDIVIMVMDTDHGRTRIGVDAPPEVAIHREEVYEKIQAEKAAEGKTS